MSKNQWKIEFGDVDQLIKKIEKIPNRSEAIINSTLKKKGAKIAMDAIQEGIPISSRKGRILNKKHAHDSKALSVKHGNLEFTIRPKKSFNYIKYPDLGIGTSQYNPEKQFFKKGLEKAEPAIVKELFDAVTKEIDKTLGE